MCLVNAERTSRGLQPVKRYVALRGTTVALGSATSKQVAAAVRLRWWGTVAEVGNCTPDKFNPARCDVHVNPETGTDPAAQARAAGLQARHVLGRRRERLPRVGPPVRHAPGRRDVVDGQRAAPRHDPHAGIHRDVHEGRPRQRRPVGLGDPGRDVRADVRPLLRAREDVERVDQHVLA